MKMLSAFHNITD